MNKPYHHIEGGFRNPPDSLSREGDFSTRLRFFSKAVWRSLFGTMPDIPEGHIANKVQNTIPEQGDYINWIGHATFLVRLDGVTVLTDPIFSNRASPVSFAGPKRLVPPAISLADLPPIDVVIISHAHYDHLDTATLDQLKDKETITAIVPLGLGKYFAGYGAVHEVDWYDEIEVKGAKFTAYPAVHWANRTLFDVNKTLWMSYGFSAGGKSVYHSGDTETHAYIFKQIGAHMADHHGGCTVGLMSVGAYNPRPMMRGAHMTPEGGVEVGTQIGCTTMIPMHWGTFILSLEPFDEPRQRFLAAAGNKGRALKIGETLILD